MKFKDNILILETEKELETLFNYFIGFSDEEGARKAKISLDKLNAGYICIPYFWKPPEIWLEDVKAFYYIYTGETDESTG